MGQEVEFTALHHLCTQMSSIALASTLTPLNGRWTKCIKMSFVPLSLKSRLSSINILFWDLEVVSVLFRAFEARKRVILLICYLTIIVIRQWNK